MGQTYTGTVVRWIAPGGYGFVFNDVIGRRVFFHIRDWHRASDPIVREEVEFELAPSPTPGKPDIAVNVTPTKPNNDICTSTLTQDGVRAECTLPAGHRQKHYSFRDSEYNPATSSFENGHSISWDDWSSDEQRIARENKKKTNVQSGAKVGVE